MKWSFSAARAFRQCQRSWFFKTAVANGRATDKLRREAYLLSKLQSVSGWRGGLVDRILSRDLVSALRVRQKVSKAGLLAIAKSQFDSELEFALAHRIREPGFSLGDDEFPAAFHAIEYGHQVSEEEIAQAWRDVETAIENLFGMEKVRGALKAAAYLVAQRSLQFAFAGVTVVAVPDVIAFYHGAPPLIVDWKVQVTGSRDYRLQLALYALALSRCNPHRDFPPSVRTVAPEDVRLLEAQLLAGAEYEYVLTAADFEELEDYIAASAAEMLAARDGLGNAELRPDDFAVTQWPDVCQRCGFRKICWEAVDGRA